MIINIELVIAKSLFGLTKDFPTSPPGIRTYFSHTIHQRRPLNGVFLSPMNIAIHYDHKDKSASKNFNYNILFLAIHWCLERYQYP